MKSFKLLIALGVVGTSLISFTPAFADELPANTSSEQTSLQTIEDENNVQYDGSHSIQARAYYGNGVHCGKEKCWVDWNQAKNDIGKIIVNGWVENGPWAHH